MIAGLTLSGFRSWARAEIGFDGRPVALYGPNGAGKTNLLEALSLLAPGRGLRGADAAALARAGGPGWRLRATLASGEEVVVTGAASGGRQVEIDGKPAAQKALGERVCALWATPAMDRLWTDAPEARRRFLDRAALSFFPDHGAAALAYQRAMRERNAVLAERPGDGAWLDALEARMAEAGAALRRGRLETVARLNAAQGGDGDAFPAARIALACSGDASDAEARARLRAARRADAAAGRALNGPHRDNLEAALTGKETPARLASTGEQKALLLGLILANARALPRPPLLLLDEATAHLDADRRAALHDALCALDAQAVLSGTGPELFESFAARARRYAVEGGAAGSRLIPAQP